MARLRRFLSTRHGKYVGVAVSAGVVFVLVGVLAADGSWGSVMVDIGIALAMVVVILSVEDAWRSALNAQLAQVRHEVAEMRESTRTSVVEAQEQHRQVRTSTDSALFSEWERHPGPASLWAIAERCSTLGLSLPAQTVASDAVVHVTPQSPTQLQLLVTPQSSRRGRVGRKIRTWTSDDELTDVVGWIEESMAALDVHPGPDLDIDSVFHGLANEYRSRIAARFAAS